jgi:GMP synthase-like glutamine amidotransferase
MFHQVRSPFLAGRYHSLVAQKTVLPTELVVSAKTSDGTIMAVEHKRWPMVGLQFHPESILTDSGYQMLMNFLKLARIKCPDPACLPDPPNAHCGTGSPIGHFPIGSDRLTQQDAT